MRADDVRDAMRRLLPVAAAMAKFTPTPKDDQAVDIVGHLFNDEELWAKVKDLLDLK